MPDRGTYPGPRYVASMGHDDPLSWNVRAIDGEPGNRNRGEVVTVFPFAPEDQRRAERLAREFAERLNRRLLADPDAAFP